MIADRETMSNFNVNSESEMTENSVFLGHCLIYLQSFACSYSGNTNWILMEVTMSMKNMKE
jgi:hypothetical protein